MDWTNQSGEAYWDIGIDGMSESVRMEKMDQKCEQTSTFGWKKKKEEQISIKILNYRLLTFTG